MQLSQATSWRRRSIIELIDKKVIIVKALLTLFIDKLCANSEHFISEMSNIKHTLPKYKNLSRI